MKRLILAFIFLSVSSAYALPTPSVKSLSWDYPAGADISGFFIYYILKSEPLPRNYVDERKLSVGPLKRDITLLSVKPDAQGQLCFRMTAYKKALEGVEIESGFGPEACGDFGIMKIKTLIMK